MSRSVRRLFVSGALVVACTLPSACGQKPGSDDERPPIIVSSGSVHMQVVAKTRGAGTNESRGQWKLDSGSANTWYHDHGGPPAKHLIVTVIHGSGDPGSKCDQADNNFDVRELSISYGPSGTSTVAYRIFIDATAPAAGKVKTDLTGSQAAIDSSVPFWLNVGSGTDRLQSVTLGTGSAAVTCHLDPTLGQVHIYQRMQ
jgi:hypothetical protein